jgi:hypothetical protein
MALSPPLWIRQLHNQCRCASSLIRCYITQWEQRKASPPQRIFTFSLKLIRHFLYGVARAGGGYATVVIKMPDGHERAIFFSMGKPIGADTSQADGYGEFRAGKENDLNLIRVGNERYEIPDAVVLGG